MRGLSGLTAIAGYQVTVDTESQATPEDRSGDIADPRHGIRGEQARPYPWESKATQAAGMHGPFGPENQLLGDEWWFFQPAGNPRQDPAMDNTPSTRAAPWPKGISSGPVPDEGPDAIANQLAQSYEIHGIDLGASAKMRTQLDPLNDQWESVDVVDPGHTDLEPLGSRQALSSGFMWGTRDRLHSFARQNEFGFDSRHSQHHRWGTGPIPGNTMWMMPGGRPMVKSLPGPARPAVGVVSPFTGHDLGRAFSADGATLQNMPMEYVPPAQPNLASASTRPAYTGSDAVVEWY